MTSHRLEMQMNIYTLPIMSLRPTRIKSCAVELRLMVDDCLTVTKSTAPARSYQSQGAQQKRLQDHSPL
jgi:hypothetical protein